ncbi:unnamed protein product [Pleuronectes platessa]|uniref:Uncharacterized protein n=1 Tax=Pleuronectes platessa TaxID=8262 RepID=A0A9N7VMA0_PLEPL|nr:unnamed protein product [Pleuronectes platessa]
MFVNRLKGMLQLEASMRLTPQQVLEHKFISMHHTARGYYHSPSKSIQTVSGSLNKPPFRTTYPIQQNRPSHVEGPPRLTNLPPCTTTQTRGPDGSGVKMEIGNGKGPDHKWDCEWKIAPNAYGDRCTWHASYNHYPSVYPSDKKKTLNGQYSRHCSIWDNMNQYK